MSRQFHHALTGLKDTYPSPDPARQEEFLNNLPKQEEKPKNIAPFSSKGKPFWYTFPAAAAAAVMLTVGIHVYRNHQPHTIPTIPAETTTTTTSTAVPDPVNAETPTASTEVSETSTEMQTGAVPTDAVQSTLQGLTTTGVVIGPVIPDRQSVYSTPVLQGTLPPVQTTTFPNGTAFTTASVTTIVSEQEDNRATTTAKSDIVTMPPESPTEFPTQDYAPPPSDSEYDPDEKNPPPAVQTTSPLVDCATTTKATTTYYHNQGGLVVEPSEPAADSPNESDSIFYTTVQPPCRYSVSENALEWNDFLEGSSGALDVSWESPAQAAQLVVSGRITDIIYTQIGGVPYMQLNVALDHVYGGASGSGTLSVYEKGGYVPLSVLNRHFTWARERTKDMTDSEIAGTMVRETASTQKWPEQGDFCVFFLNAAATPGIPDGAFEYAGQTGMSRLREVIPGLYSTADGDHISHGSLVKYLGG